jgi:hypothetical protein
MPHLAAGFGPYSSHLMQWRADLSGKCVCVSVCAQPGLLSLFFIFFFVFALAKAPVII